MVNLNRLENSILKNLIYNEEYTRKVLPFISSEYFSDNTEKNLFVEIKSFIEKYKALPTYEALVINFTESKSLTEEQVRGTIDLLKLIHQNKDEPTEVQWLTDQTEKFCQDKAIYNAIMESVSILDDKSNKKAKGEIPKILSDALGVSFDNNIGHDYIDDYEKRYDFITKKKKEFHSISITSTKSQKVVFQIKHLILLLLAPVLVSLSLCVMLLQVVFLRGMMFCISHLRWLKKKLQKGLMQTY